MCPSVAADNDNTSRHCFNAAVQTDETENAYVIQIQEELSSLKGLYDEEAERLQDNVDFWQDKVEKLIKELKQSNEAQN